MAKVRASVPLLPLDIVLTAAAYTLVFVLRLQGHLSDSNWVAFRTFLPLAIVVHIAANWIAGLYGQMWRYASIAEARRVLAAGFGSGMVLYAISFVIDLARPNSKLFMSRSVIILGALVVTYFLGGLRFQSRLFAFNRALVRRSGGLRVVVVGAGEASASIVREMLHNPNAGLLPVAVVDDDQRKHGLALMGVPVVGGIGTLAETLKQFDAQQVVLAISSADRSLIRRVAAKADEAGLPLKVLPGVKQIVSGNPSVRDVRDLQIEDLLGRKQVATDLEAVAELLGGKTVLITGAGSIGSEIARQVGGLDPACIVLIDRDETHLHDAAAVLDVKTVQVLVDIRDRDVLFDVFHRYRPDVVFHAAAHKHVPLLEDHPCEAVVTNIVGTRNVVDAAVCVGVERFVFISTDKAVRPANVMGASKWVGEQIVLAHAPPGARFCSVRFGNVLGSRGSVIPTFARQIAAGGPVTVTHPSMARFFMSVHEAVQLVLQAAVFVEGGEVCMLVMGEPVNIRDLAERMIRLSGRAVGTDVQIEISGPRPGEKLVEELRSPSERAEPTAHPSIVRLDTVALPVAVLDAGIVELNELAAHRRSGDAACVLFDLVRAADPDPDGEALIDLSAVERSESWSRSIS
jgi:FlaA1/EpsC-like NDP-sugar epimerase